MFIKKPKNKYTLPRRGAWFATRSALLVFGVIVAALFMFLTARNCANVYIIATDGMQLRAAYILGDGDIKGLQKFFTSEFIEGDEGANGGINGAVYENYLITGYDYRIGVQGVSAAPWGNSATIDIVERVRSIKGTATALAENEKIPEWTACRFRLHLVKDGAKWYIDSMELLEKNVPDEVRATPNMSISPVPAATHTPEKTDAPEKTVQPTVTPAGATPTAKPKN